MNKITDFEKYKKPYDDGEAVFSVKAFIKRVIFIISLLFFVYSIIIYVYASQNTFFAERYTMTVSAGLRQFLAGVSGVFPFSVTESLLLIGIPAIFILFIRALVLCFRYKNKNALVSFLFKFVSVVLVGTAIFINTFGICYKRVQMSVHLGIDTEDITSDDIYISACVVSDSLTELCQDIPRVASGESVMPYGFDEMVEKICEGYSRILSYIPERVSVKPVAVSEIWAYTHISGMYFPFTGESNINVSYPDYVVAFSTAHELAHQFGFAAEEDANMLAFLACVYSDDSYLAYSAFLSVFEYLIADMTPVRARQLSGSVDGRVKDELTAYFKFMNSHTNKTVTEISSKVNDTYLKANGIEQGTANYRQVTKLVAGFLKKNYPKYFEY